MSVTVDVSVIIRVRNERRALERVLGSLDRQVFNGTCEVIVIDNESDDQSGQIAAAKGARVFNLPRDLFTYGRAINLGTGLARGPVIVLLSAHAWPLSDDWLQGMFDALLSSDQRMGVFCKQIPDGTNGAGEARRFEPFAQPTFELTKDLIIDRLAAGESLYDASYFSNSAVVIRKEAVNRFPMRDLPYAEENAFALDCILHGFTVRYVAELSVVYKGPVSVAGLYHQARRQTIAEKLIEHKYANSFTQDYRFGVVNRGAIVRVLRLPFDAGLLVLRTLVDPQYRCGSRARLYDLCALAGVWGRCVRAYTWRRHRHTIGLDHAMLDKADRALTRIGSSIAPEVQ